MIKQKILKYVETDGIFDVNDEVEPIFLDLKISDDPI